MKRTVCRVLLAAAIASSVPAGAADWPKQEYVRIEDVPDSELCRETAQAVAVLREEIGWPLFRLYGEGEGAPDRIVGQLTFHGLRTRSIVFANSAGERRTLPMTYYLVDLDNRPPVEMIRIVTGGHLATGDGTTLSVMKNNFSSAPEPVADSELGNAALEIGPLDVALTGQPFDPGYYLYPFAFARRNYLFVEGNGEAYRPPEGEEHEFSGARKLSKDAVVELVPDVGLVTRCYFAAEPGAPAK